MGDARRADTHECKTEPSARLYTTRPTVHYRPCFDRQSARPGDRHETTLDTNSAEVDAALAMLDRRSGRRRLTVGADNNNDAHRFVQYARQANATPNAAQNNQPAYEILRKISACLAGRGLDHLGNRWSISSMVTMGRDLP